MIVLDGLQRLSDLPSPSSRSRIACWPRLPIPIIYQSSPSEAIMATSDGGFRNQSGHASVLDSRHILQYASQPAPRQSSSSSTASSPTMRGKRADFAPLNRPTTNSTSSSNNTRLSSSSRPDTRLVQRDVRTLPRKLETPDVLLTIAER